MNLDGCFGEFNPLGDEEEDEDDDDGFQAGPDRERDYSQYTKEENIIYDVGWVHMVTGGKTLSRKLIHSSLLGFDELDIDQVLSDKADYFLKEYGFRVVDED